MNMAWALLGIAGILEIAFAYSMKSSEGFTRLIPGLLTVATGMSSVFLFRSRCERCRWGPATRCGPASALRARRSWAWRYWAIPLRR